LTLNLATLQGTSSSYGFNDSAFKLQTTSPVFRTTERALSRNLCRRAPPPPPPRPFLRWTLPAPRAKSATISNWIVRIGEGPEYRPFCDLRSLLESHGGACTQVLFLCKAELGFFHILEIVTGWLGTFGWSKQPGSYFPPQKIWLAENRFLHAGKEAEYKGKILAALYKAQQLSMQSHLLHLTVTQRSVVTLNPRSQSPHSVFV